MRVPQQGPLGRQETPTLSTSLAEAGGGASREDPWGGWGEGRRGARESSSQKLGKFFNNKA